MMLSGTASFIFVAFVLHFSHADPQQHSWVFTSADVAPGQTKHVTSYNDDFNVYAAFSSMAANLDYYRNVVVEHTNGNAVSQNSVFDLGIAMGDKFALQPLKLNGKCGIQIHDKNPNGQRMPYVIYIVDGANNKADVYQSAIAPSIDSAYSVFPSAIIVLNAMPVMTLSSFKIRNSTQLNAYTAPYDKRMLDTRVMQLTTKAYAVLVVPGPIVTVETFNDSPFSFTVNVNNQVQNRTWMTRGSVYVVSYPCYETKDVQFSHQYDGFFPDVQEIIYPEPTAASVIVHGSFANSSQMTLSIDGTPYIYSTMHVDDRIPTRSLGKVEISIANAHQAPNYIVQITTDLYPPTFMPETTTKLVAQHSFGFSLFVLLTVMFR